MRVSGLFLPSLWAITVAAQDQLPYPDNTVSELEKCLDAADVPLYLPGSPNFAFESKPFNLRLKYRPLAIVLPTTTPEVQAAVSCAARLGVKVSAKSGGHSYASHGIGGEDDHLIVDLKYLNQVSLDKPTNEAIIGSGARLGDVALGLYEQGKRMFSHGVCPGVGVGGHVLHGGYGFSSHNLGLSLDNLLSADVVLANGTLVTAAADRNTDLFWALRGAGSSFGIATNMRFETFPAPEENVVFSYVYDWSQTQARVALEALQQYANTTIPRAMNIRLFTARNNAVVQGVFHGSRSSFDTGIRSLLDRLPGEPNATISSKGWIDTLLAYSNAPLQQPIDYDVHESFFSKSLMTVEISSEAMDKFVDYWYNQMYQNPRNWYLILDLYGGPTSAISEIPVDATSYVHRNALLKFQFYDRSDTGPFPPGGTASLNGWVDTITSSTASPVGMYINYADSSLSAREAQIHYWLGNYPRLSEIKRAVDPFSLFTNPQAVNRVS